MIAKAADHYESQAQVCYDALRAKWTKVIPYLVRSGLVHKIQDSLPSKELQSIPKVWRCVAVSLMNDIGLVRRRGSCCRQGKRVFCSF